MAWLKKDRQIEIDRTIEQLGLDSGFTFPEDDILEFAKNFKIDVYEADLPATIRGVIQYKDEQGEIKPVVYLNNTLNSNVKNFTLAHELGHYFLHPQEQKLRIDQFDYSANTKESEQESEANYFAASLLVSAIKLYQILKLTNDYDVVAKYFGVSRIVIETRMKWLTTNC
jgi:Zn-dependent peptidase ImmA (M78 family)